MSAAFTSKSTFFKEGETYRLVFFCDLCDASYITAPITAQTQKMALELARQEARRYFNRCQSCGRWVCDGHYNEDTMMCTECAPKTFKGD